MGGGFPRHGPRRPLDGNHPLGPEGGLRALALVVERTAPPAPSVLGLRQQPGSGTEARHGGCAANDSPNPATSAAAGAAPEAVGRVLSPGLPASGQTVGNGPHRAAEAVGLRGADVSLALRLGLTSGRWTLVDTYEVDGAVYVLARKSGLNAQAPSGLSCRERQAVGLATTGVSNKVIAYEMGISASTVGVLLHRAARKLGCHNRAELFARFSQIDATAPTATAPATAIGSPSEASAAAP